MRYPEKAAGLCPWVFQEGHVMRWRPACETDLQSKNKECLAL